MSAKKAYRRTSHAVYLCDYHLVLPTKYRRAIFDTNLWEYIHKKLLEITQHYPRLYIHEANHDKDHIHLSISIPPQMPVGKVVGLIKTNTARGIKQQFPHLKQIYWGNDGIWSDGYFVSTIGVDQDIIKRYIAQQGTEDTAQTAPLFGQDS